MEQISLDRLTGLVAFARVASLGSFTAAARSLSVSPSAVSKSVQRLEERFGVRLFHRTTRSLKLTADGRDLYERSLRLLREAEEIEQAAIASRGEPTGTLRVAVPLTIGVHVIAPALARLRAQHPKLSIDLRCSDHHVDLVDGGIDIAVRVGELSSSQLMSRQLAPHRLCAFASPAYLARRGQPASIEDLHAHDCVGFRYQSTGRVLRWPFLVDKKLVEFVPEPGLVMDVSDAVAAALVAGDGIGISPTYVAATYVRRGELVPVLPKLAIDRMPITALWHASRRQSPNVRAFVSFLEKTFAAPTPWDLIIAKAARLPSSWAKRISLAGESA